MKRIQFNDLTEEHFIQMRTIVREGVRALSMQPKADDVINTVRDFYATFFNKPKMPHVGQSNGVICVHNLESSLGDSPRRSLNSSLYNSLNSSLRRSLGSSLGSSLHSSLFSSLGSSLKSSLYSSLFSSLFSSLYSSLHSSLFSSLRSSLGRSLRSSLDSSLESSLRSSLGSSLRRSLNSSLFSSLESSLYNSLFSSLSDSLYDSLESSLFSSLDSSLRSSLSSSLNSGFYNGTFWCFWHICYQLAAALGVQFETTMFKRFNNFCNHCWLGLWFDNICFILPPPSPICLREAGVTMDVFALPIYELHNDGAPSWQLFDLKGYHWHNMPVPEKYGSVPSKNWKPEWFATEENVELKRVLVEVVGYDRICQTLNAKKIDEWREYSLWFCGENVDVEPLQFLKMRCPSTGKIHYSRVSPELKSARIAAAVRNYGVPPTSFLTET